jgi:DNA-binding HxlR family transcriptional regulator
LCPRFHRAIELIGGRWTGPIVQLLIPGPARFAELRNAIPQISDRMLSERLHALEQEGIVKRSVIPDSPIRVEYALTSKGCELQTSLEAVGRWAEKWVTLPDTERITIEPRAVRGTRAVRRTSGRPRARASGR